MPQPKGIHCPHWDLDDIFQYKTQRKVVIRDRRLGVTRVLIIIGLFIYVVIFEVIIRKGYLQREDPIGIVQLTVYRARGWSDTATSPYCCPTGGCASGGAGDAYGAARGQLECVSWDRHGITVPPSEESSVFVTTRVTQTVSAPLPEHCVINASSRRCGPWATATKQAYYTEGVEDMTLKIDHAAIGRVKGKVVQMGSMDKALLLNRDGDRQLNFCGGSPAGYGHRDDYDRRCSSADAQRPGDIVELRELLNAAGVTDLDTLSPAGGDTRRYDGLVLMVLIEYEGTGLDDTMRYSYSVKPMEATASHVEHKYEEVRYWYDGTAGGAPQVVRSVWNRHGIRFVFVAAGQLMWFSFAELMKTLTITVSLMSIAGFIVNYGLMSILPYSGVYKRYRDIKTVDFSSADFSNLEDIHFALGEVREGGQLEHQWEKAEAKAVKKMQQEIREGDWDGQQQQPAGSPSQPGAAPPVSAPRESPWATGAAPQQPKAQPLQPQASSASPQQPQSTGGAPPVGVVGGRGTPAGKGGGGRGGVPPPPHTGYVSAAGSDPLRDPLLPRNAGGPPPGPPTAYTIPPNHHTRSAAAPAAGTTLQNTPDYLVGAHTAPPQPAQAPPFPPHAGVVTPQRPAGPVQPPRSSFRAGGAVAPQPQPPYQQQWGVQPQQPHAYPPQARGQLTYDKGSM